LPDLHKPRLRQSSRRVARAACAGARKDVIATHLAG